MRRWFATWVILSFLLFMLLPMSNVKLVKAGSIDVPDDYPTIQEAINAAMPGDTIYVKDGGYYEHVVLNKSVALIAKGEAVIDGGGSGTVLDIRTGCIVKGFTIQNSGEHHPGIIIQDIIADPPPFMPYITITECNIVGNGVGIIQDIITDPPPFMPYNVTRNHIFGNGVGMRILNRRSFDHIGNFYIVENNITSNKEYGVYIENSKDVKFEGNIISDNGFTGVFINNSTNITSLKDKVIDNGLNGTTTYEACNIYINGSSAIIFGQLMDTLRRMPRAYGVNITRAAVFVDSSEGIRVTDSMLAGAGSGVGLYRKKGLVVLSQSFYSGNTIANFTYGIYFEEVNNAAIITRNTLANNTVGLLLDNSSGNSIYHNNFKSNSQHVMIVGASKNIWDKNGEGNYWSDHSSIDLCSGPYQNMTGSDGIGDAPYTIDADNIDKYPLMAPLSTFNAGTWNGATCNIDIVSNSTISNFQLSIINKTVSFNVAGGVGTSGFCRITIPNVIVQELWQGNYTVLLNGEPHPFKNWTDSENTYIYINYTHSTHEITIIPEFLSTLPLAVFMLTTLTATAIWKAKKRQFPNFYFY